eukprot:3745731-Rhodomonas_salina.3
MEGLVAEMGNQETTLRLRLVVNVLWRIAQSAVNANDSRDWSRGQPQTSQANSNLPVEVWASGSDGEERLQGMIWPVSVPVSVSGPKRA